tara:strand:+ start:11257 stop:12354 length:1098 start_codon:yes stop_codon:yes gene_type:complete
MKILVATGLYPPEGGGPATYSKALYDMLPSHGVEVTVLPFSRVRKYPPIIRHIVYLFLCLKLSKGSDVIYAMDPVSVGLPACIASLFTKKKFALKVVGDYAWEQGMQRFGVTELLDSFLKRDWYSLPVQILRSIEIFVAKRARKVVVPSEYLKKVVTSWGIEKEKIKVIYNAAPNVEGVGHKKVLRGLLKYHGKYVITIARLVPWKGIKELIDAVDVVEKNGIDVQLLVVGDGPERESLEKHAEGKKVSFAGKLPHDITLAYLKAADVFALNTGYEGFSHLLLEAQAVGTPTVTTNVGGNPELITHGKNGLLVPYKDTKALTGAITQALINESFRRSARDIGKRKAAKFSKDRMVRETKEMLELL